MRRLSSRNLKHCHTARGILPLKALSLKKDWQRCWEKTLLHQVRSINVPMRYGFGIERCRILWAMQAPRGVQWLHKGEERLLQPIYLRISISEISGHQGLPAV